MVEFGGFEMPLSYPSGTVAEHLSCRQDAVVFDVSHLGTVRVTGTDARERLDLALCNDLSKIAPGRAQYTQLLNDTGGVLDDIIVWWVSTSQFDVMPNASNTERVLDAVGGEDVTAGRTVLAVQGPGARRRLLEIAPDAAGIGRFRVAPASVAGCDAMVAGTGYTGEDGIEIAVDNEHAEHVFAAVLDAGVLPAGLGARDTLRLEAGLPLHGHELSESITPLEAGLGWVVGWDKPAFQGKDALVAQRASGPSRVLRGFETSTRQPPRDGAEVLLDGEAAGVVTSGNFSPVLGHGIALALVGTARPIDVGREVQLNVRDRRLDAACVAVPFVKKQV
jgi:aminomethyltransferase